MKQQSNEVQKFHFETLTATSVGIFENGRKYAIANCIHDGSTHLQACKDAEKLCLAVNNHDKLVEALQSIAECAGFPNMDSNAKGFVKIAERALNNLKNS